MKYKRVVVGGTFDFLHDGHKAILSKAFEIGETVLVGIVSDRMRLRKDSAGISSLEERRKELINYLNRFGWRDRAEFVVISDAVGPAGVEDEIDAIVVSEETRSGAEKINKVRSRGGLGKLDVIEVPLVIADDGEPISSIRIRYGEIDVHGNLKDNENNKIGPC